MTATAELTAELRAQVLLLTDDLRARLGHDADREHAWRDEHQRAIKAQRTAAAWSDFADERLTQAAVAWVLMTVFVRFCEDNDLLQSVWITGPGARRQEALDAQDAFLRETARTNPDVTDREWLLQAADYLAAHNATRALVDASSPLWLIAPSGDAATALIAFWRERDDDGVLRRDLTDPGWDTRFLGDLYQDLSAYAKAKYALLQTPVFVEEFILDRTLTPALRDRPLDGFRMIDPACGSGHFLLGAFARLLDRWHAYAPALDRRERVQRALDAINGVDLNPFAVAITRFRLTVAAMKASGDVRLDDAPAFRFHLAVGDSLLHGVDQQQTGIPLAFAPDEDTAAAFAYGTEDLPELRRILTNGSYDCVVGNPPYITVKDKSLNGQYREHWSACKGTYAMTVPFAQRFFALARLGERAGWVGQITSNSFMKREFGSKLIEEFFPRIDLRLVADTSGAYIPGHGTPTVILVGRNSRPGSYSVRAVLGVRGEPGRPADASKGIVWTSIVEHVDEPGWNDEWISVTDLDRGRLATHPWSLTGGGADSLTAAIIGDRPLGSRIRRVGFFGIMGSDAAMISSMPTVRQRLLEAEVTRLVVIGDQVRDFGTTHGEPCWFPYGVQHELLDLDQFPRWGSYLWSLRTDLRERPTFSGESYAESGKAWYEWHQLPKDIDASPLSIAFAFVSTHNHFVLDRGGKVFKQSAPVIKLPEGATEDDHLALLGVLNSSTACFWLKQNSHNKGNGGIGGGIGDEAWEPRYEFTGTTLLDFPLPNELVADRGRALDDLARSLASVDPAAVVEAAAPTRSALDEAHSAHEQISADMVALQEELDWDTYRLYGLIEDDLTFGGADVPGLALGERAFEIALARRVESGEETTAWFTRHGSTPITGIPAHWPEAYRALVARRIELAESHPFLRLLEQPEHKRRWAGETWEQKEERAVRGWLLDRLEDRRFWFDPQGRPITRSVAQLADLVDRDAELRGVLELWEGRPDVHTTESLKRLLKGEAVPFLAAYRYTDSGLRKRADWEQVWDRQREEDRTGVTDPTIPVPPKYKPVDFRNKDYWTHRGKLDVPKERFVGYPGAERGADTTPVLGWAGWDHAQQALALAQLVQLKERDGAASAERVPLAAGLAELQPWLDQWHAEPDHAYGGQSPAEYFRTYLTDQAHKLERTVDQLSAWRPPPPTRGRRARNGGKVDTLSTLVDADTVYGEPG